MRYREHVGPVVAEQLSKKLPVSHSMRGDYRMLPDGTDILVGTEWVYAFTEQKPPASCAIDLGGNVPLVLWKEVDSNQGQHGGPAMRRTKMNSDKITPMWSFADWMALVDAHVEAKAGVSVYDLPDCAFADWHQDGFTPQEAAGKAIRAARAE